MDDSMRGDISNPTDQAQLSPRVTKVLGQKPVLYTSDVGADLRQQYNDQETICLSLQYGQAVSALLCLGVGGTAILKQFTFATPFIQSLIVFLSSVFEKLDICKPLTSRGANSEIYVVGQGFKGISPKTEKWLISWMGYVKPENSIVDLGQQPIAMQRLQTIARRLCLHQTKKVQSMIDFMTPHQRQKNTDWASWSNWIQQNPIMPLTTKL
jgi:hypothetical protein